VGWGLIKGLYRDHGNIEISEREQYYLLNSGLKTGRYEIILFGEITKLEIRKWQNKLDKQNDSKLDIKQHLN